MPAYTNIRGVAFGGLLVTHSRILNPTYGSTVHSGLVPMMGILLNCTSRQLFHETGTIEPDIELGWIKASTMDDVVES